ncbi:MAG: HAMP domain-containing sensor histidine kinase [Microthrixaceae bacterium]
MTARARTGVAVAILAAGLMVAAALAWAGGIPTDDTLVLIGTASAGTAVVAAATALSRRLRFRQPFVVHAGVIALASMAATATGVVVAARAMFISSHDLWALGTILATAAAGGLAVAWSLAARVDRDVRTLTAVSERLANGEQAPPPASQILELDELGRDLVDYSAQLQEAHSRELALERSRRELVAWVSHDLRSPLASIRAMAEALEDGVVTDRAGAQRYLRSIAAETDRLAALVDDLFELSRVTSGILSLDRTRVDLTDLLERSARGAAEVAAAKGVEVRLPDPSSCSSIPELHVADTETVRIIRNLLDNAVRHTPSGGVVAVSASRQDSVVEVSVTDECGGIPQPDLERVFEVAYRGDNARGRDGGGGLGLAVARGLVTAQDGTIGVANHPGGCCFTVTLPLVDGQ